MARERRQGESNEPNPPASVETTPKPAETTAKPAETTAKPAETTAKPVETTAKPAGTGGEAAATTAPAKGKDTTDGHEGHDHEKDDHSSAAVAGATACLLTTLFSL